MKSAHDLPSKSKRPSIKLTTKVVREFSLPPDRDDDTLFDTDVKGFGVRKGGSRKFVFVYKLSSKQRRMGLGATSARSVDDARKAAGKLHARVIDGQDPASEKADAKLKAAETFKATAEDRAQTQSLLVQIASKIPADLGNTGQSIVEHRRARPTMTRQSNVVSQPPLSENSRSACGPS